MIFFLINVVKYLVYWVKYLKMRPFQYDTVQYVQAILFAMFVQEKTPCKVQPTMQLEQVLRL